MRASTSSRIRFALGLVDSDKDYYASEARVLEFAAYGGLKDWEEPILELLRSEGLAEMRMLDLGVGGGRTTVHFAPAARDYHGRGPIGGLRTRTGRMSRGPSPTRAIFRTRTISSISRCSAGTA
jgi:hypothetical protein